MKKYLCQNNFDEESICRVVLTWINQFDELTNRRQITDIRHLNDGVIIFKLLNLVSPKIFKVSSINLYANTRTQKVANIEKIQRCLGTFYKQKLGINISNLIQNIDPSNIAQARKIQGLSILPFYFFILVLLF